MNCKTPLSNYVSLNEITLECASVTGELKSIKEEDTGEYSDGENFKTQLDFLPVEPVVNKTAIVDGIRTSGEQYRQGVPIKTEIKLENIDVEGNSPGLNEGKHVDFCKGEKTPNILIKSDSDVCSINKADMHGMQISTNTDIDSYGEYNPSYCVKDEITIDESYLEKKEAANGGDGSMHELLHNNQSRSQIPTNEREFHCAICSKGFKFKRSLSAHRLVHTLERPFECAICNKPFKHEANLRRHKLVHTSERRFECTHCGKRFKCNQDLMKHALVHSNERLFECALCNKSFKMKKVLRRHEAVHTNERAFECEHCRKRFKDKLGLMRHERTHSDVLGFECFLCNKRFRFKRNLVSHQACHTDSRPFVCEYCGKSFKRKVDLTQHESVHTHNRPFVCAYCDKSFKRKNDLTRHESVHTQQPSILPS